MEKVRPWCGQPSDRGRLRNRTEHVDTGALPVNSTRVHRPPAKSTVVQCFLPTWSVDKGARHTHTRVHGPMFTGRVDGLFSRLVCTGVREHGTRVFKMTPVYIRHPRLRPVNTGSVYRP